MKNHQWKVTGEGDNYIIRLLLPSGEQIEYDLPHQPASRSVDDVTQFWWEHEDHIYSLVVPVGWGLEIVAPNRFEDAEVLEIIKQAKQA